MSEFPYHERGAPCPVVDLLHGHFGAEFGGYLLWEFTCFPCDDGQAYEQARSLVAADRVGLLDQYLESERAAVERAMQDAAARA